jgi:hypothetical protein
MGSTSYNQLIARVLVNIANGYEPEDGALFPNRFGVYKQLQG